MLFDAFICHASEDKDAIVRPLAERLSAHHLHIWYDEFSLKVGDSLRRVIDEGLSKSRFGIVILSPAFFRKSWPQRELDGLVAREIAEDRRLILPIWHGIDREEIVRISPPLADAVAARSEEGLNTICAHLLKKLRPVESPLIAARDELLRRGIEPPVISDEWWLDIVEASNRMSSHGPYVPEQSVWGTWSFPLPNAGESGANRGLHLAWTALQIDWSLYAEDHKICQITHPNVVHEYIDSFPGLSELCEQFPEQLACYAPQLTIPEFSGRFSNAFDRVLMPSEKAQGRSLCSEEISLRHPTFGEHEPSSIACFYVQGPMFGPSSKCYEIFDYLVWLLSRNSLWLPEKHRDFLIRGMKDWAAWPSGIIGDRSNPFADAVLTAASPRSFRFTNPVRTGLQESISTALARLGIEEEASRLVDEFKERRILEGYFELRNRRARKARRKSNGGRKGASKGEEDLSK